MADDAFNDQLLTDKLSKLNSSQQSIESVSKWCISHRKKAKQVVETWEVLFKSAQPQQQVSFLYLSNDILQNSRRRGSEFVNEFWKVLPAALKGVYDGGNENCKKVALRLIGIFEERKVFGSRGHNLKSDVLGEHPSRANNVKSLNPIKVVKRDATSLRTKLAVGSLPEKILTAMHLVHDEFANEEAALSKCHDAVSCLLEIEKDVVNASSQGNPQAEVIDTIEKQKKAIQQCISELEKSEERRVALVFQLKEALQDQESMVDQIRRELLVARSQIEQVANIRLQLTPGPLSMNRPPVDPTFPPLPTGNPPLPPPPPLPPFSISTDEDIKKAAAAAVAAKLAASTSSAQMLTSILSSLVAEEAASVTAGLKRPKLETTEDPPPAPRYFTMSPGTMQAASQVQAPPFLPPQPPPLPLAPPELIQAVQPGGVMGVPFNYGPMAFALPPGPPTHMPQQGQPTVSGVYLKPVGVGFYGQTPTPPPLHHQ